MISSWVRRALVLVAAVTLASATPADAKSADRTGSGAGALVEYQVSRVLEGRSITASVLVFVVVPGDPSIPTYLATGVKETDDETGAELFAGTGVGAPGSFTVGADFANARVTGEITVQSANSGATRVVDIDVVWSPLDPTQKVKLLDHDGGPGGASLERHTGVVRRMTGVGVVTVSDPSRAGWVFTITEPGLGCAWDTTDTSKGGDGGPPAPAGAGASGGVSIAATSTGYWTGYWTWKWDGTKWVSVWTWVYVYTSTGYTTS